MPLRRHLVFPFQNKSNHQEERFSPRNPLALVLHPALPIVTLLPPLRVHYAPGQASSAHVRTQPVEEAGGRGAGWALNSSWQMNMQGVRDLRQAQERLPQLSPLGWQVEVFQHNRVNTAPALDSNGSGSQARMCHLLFDQPKVSGCGGEETTW